MTKDLIYKEETYKIIGLCMEVHRELGYGFLEIVYKDALELLFQQHQIPYEREKELPITFRNVVLPRKFFADFMVYNNIILEAKSKAAIIDEHIAQTLNYLKASKNKLGLLVNFGRLQLEYKRLIF